MKQIMDYEFQRGLTFSFNEQTNMKWKADKYETKKQTNMKQKSRQQDTGWDGAQSVGGLGPNTKYEMKNQTNMKWKSRQI